MSLCIEIIILPLQFFFLSIRDNNYKSHLHIIIFFFPLIFLSNQALIRREYFFSSFCLFLIFFSPLIQNYFLLIWCICTVIKLLYIWYIKFIHYFNSVLICSFSANQPYITITCIMDFVISLN